MSGVCLCLMFLRVQAVYRQFRLPLFVLRMAFSNSCKDRQAAKYSIIKSVLLLGSISRKCLHFIDNPFKVVAFVRIYCQMSSYLFEIKKKRTLLSLFYPFITSFNFFNVSKKGFLAEVITFRLIL